MAACGKKSSSPWNDPYPNSESKANIRYTSFPASPKTLDPARAYSTNETEFITQICEPPLQYHFLKRPYVLVPLTASKMPTITFLDKALKPLSGNSKVIAFTAYDIAIKPGIYYQPHPAFAKNSAGQYYYLNLSQQDLKSFKQFRDFTHLGSRELVADDYVYEIKRLAAPGINSPIYGLMAEKIRGLADFSHQLSQNKNRKWLDLRKYPLVGATTIDRYHYRILIKGEYPQFLYWLAMPFFCPIPWEADAFYSQPGMERNNITFDWHPIGTGAYMLSENNPNRRMVLNRNPLFHEEYFPQEGETGDTKAGYLKDAGKRLPFIDQAVFTLEKESIPRWNKFLQGYYDQSAISADSFDQAVQLDVNGNPMLTPLLKEKGIYLQTIITPSILYMGFNMLDKVVGGNSERARKLRLAISIAIDFEEYIHIFLNGRGKAAHGPLPPTIFGHQNGLEEINPYVYYWKKGRVIRKPIAVAKRLMTEAGYRNGIDPKTDNPLILNYDFASTGGPDEKPFLEWLRSQFAKIGIELNIRGSDYNRFQEKMRLGKTQIFIWAWTADYPDPENFLFLLYGANGKVKYGGENAANYQNAEFDKLFNQMKNLPNTKKRLQIIDNMLAIVRHDAPWIWGVYEESLTLNQQWDIPAKLNALAQNILKYQRIDPLLRYRLRNAWNHRVLWPLGVLLFLFILISLPVFIRYQQKERESIKGKENQ
jgi:oligopeptide transport system substrate-binding protein